MMLVVCIIDHLMKKYDDYLASGCRCPSLITMPVDQLEKNFTVPCELHFDTTNIFNHSNAKIGTAEIHILH